MLISSRDEHSGENAFGNLVRAARPGDFLPRAKTEPARYLADVGARRLRRIFNGCSPHSGTDAVVLCRDAGDWRAPESLLSAARRVPGSSQWFGGTGRPSGQLP